MNALHATPDIRSSTLFAAMLLALAAASPARADEAARAAFFERQAALRALGDNNAKAVDPGSRIFAAGFEVAVASDCGSDRDGDGLADCVETNTGRFIDSSDTGTDPDLADTDGDGITDGEEVLGTETGLDLAALGASPLRRDLLIEYDWFESDYECGLHSQRPSQEVLARVAQMFADAPVSNPDGSTGIHLIQDHGQGAGLDGGNRVTGFDAILPGRLDQTFYEIKAQNFDPARLGYFRYVLLPHRYDGGSQSSGYAEVVGDDAIVSMACQTFDDYLVRVIAHELGHLLGLRHGGYETCNGKPNYNSLMNYRFTFNGVDDNCDATGDFTRDDFSHGERLVLDEAAVDEHAGVCGSEPIDFNADGQIEAGLALDLNPGNDATCGTGLRELDDFDDWNHLTFFGLAEHTGALKGLQDEVDCAGPPLPGKAH